MFDIDLKELHDRISQAAVPEPEPTGEGVPVFITVFRELFQMPIFPRLNTVVEDLMSRIGMGVDKYGTYLRSNNGRNAAMDAYQESLDLVMYIAQMYDENQDPEILERLRDTMNLSHWLCGKLKGAS